MLLFRQPYFSEQFASLANRIVRTDSKLLLDLFTTPQLKKSLWYSTKEFLETLLQDVFTT